MNYTNNAVYNSYHTSWKHNKNIMEQTGGGVGTWLIILGIILLVFITIFLIAFSIYSTYRRYNLIGEAIESGNASTATMLATPELLVGAKSAMNTITSLF